MRTNLVVICKIEKRTNIMISKKKKKREKKTIKIIQLSAFVHHIQNNL